VTIIEGDASIDTNYQNDEDQAQKATLIVKEGSYDFMLYIGKNKAFRREDSHHSIELNIASNIHAKTPQEIAVAYIAELIKLRRTMKENNSSFIIRGGFFNG